MKAHPESYEFIRKNFGDINQDVALEKFIQKIMREYETFGQNMDKIFDDFM